VNFVTENTKIKNDENAAGKREWSRPELKRLEAGAAESNETGGGPDNSAPQRS
jgi:hypothetical protein